MADSNASFDPQQSGLEGLRRMLTKSQQILRVRGPWPPDMRKTFTRRRSKGVDETAESMLERIQRDIAKYHVRRSLGALHTLACTALCVLCLLSRVMFDGAAPHDEAWCCACAVLLGARTHAKQRAASVCD